MPSSKLDRDEMINDLTVYAKLLNESQRWTRSFEHVYELLSSEDYSVSLQTFVIVMSRIPLTPFQKGRLEKISTLLQWTDPHNPDLAEFSALWHLTSVEDENQIWVEIEDESVTTLAVETLFMSDEDQLIDALDHECVLVRAAATIAAMNEESFLERFQDALDNHNDLVLENAMYYGVTVEEYVNSSTFKDEYAEMLANFSGDREDMHLLESYPYVATECKCVDGQTAVDNYFKSLQMFWFTTKHLLGPLETTEELAVWSNRPDPALLNGVNLDQPSFFTVALPTKTRHCYQLEFAYGPLVVSFSTVPGNPGGDWQRWFDSWDTRLEMFDALLEELRTKVTLSEAANRKQTCFWQFHEELMSDGSVETTNLITGFIKGQDGLVKIEAEDFDGAFSAARSMVFSY